ncbi:MAG: carbamoyltransferase HypF [Myxococcota bacterium]
MSAIVTDTPSAISLRFRGVVQGVGFRPTVARVAQSLGLTGHVANDGDGVRVLVEGPRASDFQSALLAVLPPLARVDTVEVREVNTRGYDAFTIRPSEVGASRTEVVADSAMCSACWEEVKSPYERRYRYPFTNCTHCGPRFSLIEGMPYDRSRTTMARFDMCPACRNEYENPDDRRYHAQPVACHACGPKAWLERGDGAAVVSDMFSGLDDVDAIATLLKQGEIVAIRSVGGYHLACDATQSSAVEALRAGKARETQPFAVMVRDLDVLRAYAEFDETERSLLESPAAPIVLLRQRDGADKPLSGAVAPGTDLLGAMLPYTPLHGLVMKRMNVPVVMTSGNVHGEPQCIGVDDAMERLGSLTPWFLHHNREIVDRIDDSVTRVISGAPTVLRRGRGYAPDAWGVPPGVSVPGDGLAMGGDLKSAFALASSDRLILSQHIGDLDDPQTRDAYERAIARYVDLFDVVPRWIAVDAHPIYASRAIGEALAERFDAEVILVQHHHAHVASCLADHGTTGPAVGIVLDGLGWGSDGSAWGGEVLVADYAGFRRVAALRPQPLLGGDRAAREPWRNTYAQLAGCVGWESVDRSATLRAIAKRRSAELDSALTSGALVESSSAGRLFDSVAAALGIFADRISHEAQAAMALEALAGRVDSDDAYSFASVVDSEGLTRLDPTPMWRALIRDLDDGASSALVARKFHLGLANGFAELALSAAAEASVDTVVLSGGCMANRIIVETMKRRLTTGGVRVLTHRRTPTGDGGLALGQLVVAATQRGMG